MESDRKKTTPIQQKGFKINLIGLIGFKKVMTPTQLNLKFKVIYILA